MRAASAMSAICWKGSKGNILRNQASRVLYDHRQFCIAGRLAYKQLLQFLKLSLWSNPGCGAGFENNLGCVPCCKYVASVWEMFAAAMPARKNNQCENMAKMQQACSETEGKTRNTKNCFAPVTRKLISGYLSHQGVLRPEVHDVRIKRPRSMATFTWQNLMFTMPLVLVSSFLWDNDVKWTEFWVFIQDLQALSIKQRQSLILTCSQALQAQDKAVQHMNSSDFQVFQVIERSSSVPSRNLHSTRPHQIHRFLDSASPLASPNPLLNQMGSALDAWGNAWAQSFHCQQKYNRIRRYDERIPVLNYSWTVHLTHMFTRKQRSIVVNQSACTQDQDPPHLDWSEEQPERFHICSKPNKNGQASLDHCISGV